MKGAKTLYPTIDYVPNDVKKDDAKPAAKKSAAKPVVLAQAKSGDVIDAHIYPGPYSPEPTAERAAVLGEFGGLSLPVEGHKWSPNVWGHKKAADLKALTSEYEQLLAKTWELKDKPGLSGAIYTQLTDVESEGNGLVTYDREVIKMDIDRVKAANTGKPPVQP